MSGTEPDFIDFFPIPFYNQRNHHLERTILMRNYSVSELGSQHDVTAQDALYPPQKRYLLIDIFRVFCALLVVILHCLEIPDGHPFAHMIVVCFSQQAVPFFFLVSGFFLGKKLYASSNPLFVTKRYAKSQLLLYGGWMIIEFPSILATYQALYTGCSPLYLLAVIIRRILFAGQGVYWYLLVLAESALISGLCVHLKREHLLYAAALIGLMLGFIYDAGLSFLFFGKMNQLFYMLFSWSNNFIMKGLPYVALGTLFARYERHISCRISYVSSAYVLVSLASILLFLNCIKTNIQLTRYMFLYPAQAVLLFLIGICSDFRNANAKVGSTLREMSSTLYFLHTAMIYRIADAVWGVNAPILLKFSIAVSLSLAVFWIAKRSKFKPLCWMLSVKA